MSTVSINPPSLYDGAPIGMSQAKVDLVTGMIFVSGQVDWSEGGEVRHATMAGQTEGAIDNLVAVLEAARSSVENILQLRIYVKGDVNAHMAALVPIVARRLGVTRPALTGVGVQSLASENTLIEIEAIARVNAID